MNCCQCRHLRSRGVLVYRINIYACLIKIEVPHEVKNQRALTERTSQIMINGQDVNIRMRSGTRCSSYIIQLILAQHSATHFAFRRLSSGKPLSVVHEERWIRRLLCILVQMVSNLL